MDGCLCGRKDCVCQEFDTRVFVDTSMQLKPSNPKDDIGVTKPPLSLWPAVATLAGSLAMHDGRLKYGKANFRAIGVRVSVYLDAAKRHLDKYNEGQWADPETGVPHLGYAMACCAIVLESHYAGNLMDDRPIAGGYLRALEELTPVVKALSEMRKDLHPKHYTREGEDQ